MAQNITLMGATYNAVPAVQLPKQGGGTAQFDDTTDANATADDIMSGKTAYVNGTKLTGTASGGGYDTSDATAAATDVVSGKVFYNASGRQTGSVTSRSSSDLSASGATVTAPAGFYGSNATKTISSGSATPASTISGTSASVSTGTNTLTLSKTVSNTPSVSAGYISSGTSGNSSVSLTASVTTKAAATITPGTSNQTISSGTYLTGTQTISGDANLVAGNIKKDVSIFGVTGTYDSGGGGGSGPELLGTKSLGALSTTSTSATDTGQSMTVSGINAYDLLIIETSVDTKTNSRHAATAQTYWLTGTSSISSKTGGTLATATWNCKISSNGTATSRSGTTAYGIYGSSITVSDGSITIGFRMRYNSTSSGTINGNYTARVYGVKTYDLIGG